MKNTLYPLLIVVFAFLSNHLLIAQNTTLDPFTLKVEMFSNKNIKDKMEFVDKDGLEYRVVNTQNNNGVEIKNGKRWLKHGVYFSLYNGKISLSETYDYGVKSGESLRYSDGKLQFRKNYVNNLEEGTSFQYSNNGDVAIKADYVGGKKHGKEVQYYENEKLFEKNWVEGKLHGESLQFNKGKLVSKTIYNEGKQVGNTIWY